MFQLLLLLKIQKASWKQLLLSQGWLNAGHSWLWHLYLVIVIVPRRWEAHQASWSGLQGEPAPRAELMMRFTPRCTYTGSQFPRRGPGNEIALTQSCALRKGEAAFQRSTGYLVEQRWCWGSQEECQGFINNHQHTGISSQNKSASSCKQSFCVLAKCWGKGKHYQVTQASFVLSSVFLEISHWRTELISAAQTIISDTSDCSTLW